MGRSPAHGSEAISRQTRPRAGPAAKRSEGEAQQSEREAGALAGTGAPQETGAEQDLARHVAAREPQGKHTKAKQGEHEAEDEAWRQKGSPADRSEARLQQKRPEVDPLD